MIQSISAAEAQRRLQDANPPLLLDVREPEEHQFCAIPGSTLIPLAELSHRVDELGENLALPIILYCHHGMRSLHAAQHLSALGFKNLFNLQGGIDSWSREVDSTTPLY